jgi:hypothetical protein
VLKGEEWELSSAHMALEKTPLPMWFPTLHQQKDSKLPLILLVHLSELFYQLNLSRAATCHARDCDKSQKVAWVGKGVSSKRGKRTPQASHAYAVWHTYHLLGRCAGVRAPAGHRVGAVPKTAPPQQLS